MNKKLAIFGFSILWIAAIAAILFVMLPKLSSNKEEGKANNVENLQNEELSNNEETTKDEDSFFYDKKVFVRHRKNDTDTTASVQEKVILVRKNIFFKPPVKPKPIIKQAPKKVDNSDFDIKPVPTN
jgi:type III secretory pathway component EscV